MDKAVTRLCCGSEPGAKGGVAFGEVGCGVGCNAGLKRRRRRDVNNTGYLLLRRKEIET
jgi:hypothetical protein